MPATMPVNSKTWFRLRWRTLFLLVIVGAVVWSAYSYWSEYSEQAARKARELMSPYVGAHCTVVFTAEALGIENNFLGSAEIKGVKNSVHGQFVKLNDLWIVLTAADGQQQWIPREHVLLMRVGP